MLLQVYTTYRVTNIYTESKLASNDKGPKSSTLYDSARYDLLLWHLKESADLKNAIGQTHHLFPEEHR